MKRDVYALKNNKEICSISTSGGAYLAICKVLFEMYPDKLAVFGVVFDDSMKLQYKVAYNYEDSKEFCRSKYIFCGDASFCGKVENELRKENAVLFIGVPCQCSALKRWINDNKIDDTNLYVVDLICNGTPSEKLWMDYVAWIEKKYKSQLVNFFFRSKEDNSNPYMTQAVFSNGLLIKDKNTTAAYNQLFLKKLILRKVCFDCKFKAFNRVGDFTIGDFWGISDVLPDFHEQQEVSEVIVNTEKADIVFQEVIKNKEVKILQCTNDRYIDYQSNLKEGSKLPADYEAFWIGYEKNGIDYVIKKYSDGSFFGKCVYLLKKINRKIKK